ncbi:MULTISPECIES: L-threonylcarbamoyladenylate synthase [unclassified Leeuwenhoekiella]|uniref:L-threonylcarbamoyladenylate synthase n=1 Tax=unclassified Leeuwenhoekiella TaxID=2615029 RepID=UPI000C6810BB|nr:MULTISPECIES: L-threonylcarbamoyladenylate synthase [unclassified Leeuwenhoekiella]MAW94884.1 threonylcarbamoyl-AMP synthase [Leeuwenhoekiella sp.]|tara:strand:- start:1158 stop:1745 length:588 start_codon:yes stop_codon:yes gene_type:complete
MPKKKYDQRIFDEVSESLPVLKRGGLLLYPTDTVWGIGCDATNAEAVDKIYELKKRPESKALICLVSDLKMLRQYVEDIPEVAYNILKYADQPTTIVYDNPIRIAENLVGADNTLGIRIVQDEFCQTLIRKLGKPLVSTSANLSGEPTPMRYPEISAAVLEGVDYVVNLQRKHKSTKSSTVIRLSSDGQVKILRK